MSTRELRVLDLCTGTGCISLLLYSILSRIFQNICIRSVDISSQSINLARKNLQRNVVQGNIPSSALEQIRFIRGDVFDPGLLGRLAPKDDYSVAHNVDYDVLVSNPPYISPSGFIKDTSRSVRNWEPKLALVPCARSLESSCKRGDEFYPVLLGVAMQVRCRLMALEVADMEQAKRVVSMVREIGKWEGVEIWGDWVDHRSRTGSVNVGNGREVTVRGEGDGRVVVCWNGEVGLLPNRIVRRQTPN
ncbi:MAG: hypothetical protein M1813_003143 [Trichoglossum hirsutum]|jgi:methylase of polypeptide subunit release factors|nr:MAG: hypothetical protein M1813_003143 [Trichoglossum hirsutum]